MHTEFWLTNFFGRYLSRDLDRSEDYFKMVHKESECMSTETDSVRNPVVSLCDDEDKP
jgi:hypothetical protein